MQTEEERVREMRREPSSYPGNAEQETHRGTEVAETAVSG